MSRRVQSALMPGFAILLLAIITLFDPGSVSGREAAAVPAGTPRGHLFIVGGGPRPQEFLDRFIELAGGRGHARIVVFGMASSDPSTGPEEADEIRAAGAQAQSIAWTREQADTDEAARRLDGSTGIWFCGGDQSNLTRALAGTKVEAAIHRLYENGAAVGGTSAGAAVMTTPMITGDERHQGGSRPPADKENAFLTIARDNIVTAAGFGLLPGAVVDQHFVRRKRNNRLLSVVLEQPDRIGVGIDESTALEVDPDGTWRIFGESVAVVYDARGAKITPHGRALGATDVHVHVLPAGSRFDPQNGEATLPPIPPGS